MKQNILKTLDKIEAEFNVKIVYACESGSRAWGFPSSDSDYDVRFIYLHHPDWYLSINLESKKNVIELPIDEKLDVSGWDLRKALKLFRKSNPPLLEWLGSPIKYLERFSTAEQMRQLAPTCYSPGACMYHYLHMVQGNNREYLQGEKVWVKKYFYVLRPLLAILWLEKKMGVVPTEFQVLVDAVVENSKLKNDIYKLIEDKKQGKELDQGHKIPVISDFINKELERLENEPFNDFPEKCDIKKLNEIFRFALKEAWDEY